MKEKTYWAKIMVALTTAALSFSSSTYSQVKWLRNFDDAKELARRENKLILADFWASWCGPCIRMDREVWRTEEITKLSKKFVCVRLNSDFNRGISMRYQIRSIPAVLFLDYQGNKLLQYTGYRSAVDMGATMSILPEDWTQSYQILTSIEKQPDNVALNIALADYYRALGKHMHLRKIAEVMIRKSNEYYKEATSNSKKANRNPALIDKAETCKALNYLFLGNPSKAKKLLKTCLEKFPKSKQRPVHLYCLIRANLALHSADKAHEYLEILEAEFPNDEFTKSARQLLAVDD